MWPYTRRQLAVLVGVVLTAGVGLGVTHWRARHPEVVERIEQFDHAPTTPVAASRTARAATGLAADGGVAGDAMARRMSAPALAGDTGWPRPGPQRGAAWRPGVRRRAPEAGPLDLNRATAEELRGVPGLGPVLAGRIVAARTSDGPFQSVDDLRRVRGLGRSRLDRLRPFVIVRN